MRLIKRWFVVAAVTGIAWVAGIGSAYDSDSKSCGIAWLQLFECPNGAMAWILNVPGIIVSWKPGSNYSTLVPPVQVQCTWTLNGVDCNGNPISRISTSFVSTQYPANNCSN